MLNIVYKIIFRAPPKLVHKIEKRWRQGGEILEFFETETSELLNFTFESDSS